MTQQAQFGFAVETTYGTRVAANRFLPFLSEGLKVDIEQIVSSSVRPGRRTRSVRRAGKRQVSGPIKLELAPQGAVAILEHCFGARSTSGAGPYTHVFTPGSLSAKSLSGQIIKEDEGSTMRPHDFVGLQITGGSIVSAIGKNVELTLNVFGADTDLTQSAATPTFPSGWFPFAHVVTTVSIGGADYMADEISVSWDNGLTTGRHAHRATNAALPRQGKSAGFASFTGMVAGDYFNNTAYQRGLSGTEAAVSIVMSDGASAQLTIAGNVRFTPDTPNVEGPQLVKNGLPFEFTSTTSDAAAFTATLISGDALP